MWLCAWNGVKSGEDMSASARAGCAVSKNGRKRDGQSRRASITFTGLLTGYGSLGVLLPARTSSGVEVDAVAMIVADFMGHARTH